MERHGTGPGVNEYVMDHSTYLYVMDPEGKFVRAFHGDTSGESSTMCCADC
jgi:protein SCO1